MKNKKKNESLAAEREKYEQEIRTLAQKIEKTQERIKTRQEEYGDKLVSETELKGLNQRKKNYEVDLEKAKKELAALEKQSKEKEKIQAKVDREKKKLAEMERERNTIEERLNSTKD